MIFSVVLLVLGWAMGAVFFWDVRGIATSIRERLEARPITGPWNKRLPSWYFRAFGVWCFVFSVAQLIYFIVTT